MERTYKEGDIKDFEIKILAGGECLSFIPMAFVKEDAIRAIYQTQGYGVIKDFHNISSYKLLDIIEKVVIAIKNGNNYMILYDRYCLSLENIYINEAETAVKILFVPQLEKVHMEFSRKIEDFLLELKTKDYDIRAYEYLDMIINKISNYNLTKDALINYIGELKREVYICSWEQ